MLVLVLSSVLSLAACGGSGGSNSRALKELSAPGHAWTVTVPGDWRFRDASYPSDHTTWYWYNPNNPFAKLRVVVSACVGCVTKNLDGVTPNPRAELPANAIVTASPNRYSVNYRVFDTPYPDRGLIVVTRDASGITGSMVADLWLPGKKSAEAKRILSGIRPG
jgi:hypothetical protein